MFKQMGTGRGICLVCAVVMLPAVTSTRVAAAVFYDVTPLHGIGNYDTMATAINNDGDVVGGAFTGVVYDPFDWQQKIYTAFLWQNGQGTNLLGGSFSNSTAVDINAAGQILIHHSSLMWAMAPPYAQLYTNGVFATLDANSVGAVNALGQVVGQDVSGDSFVWDDGQKTYLSLAGTPWQSVKLAGINDSGWVVGRGVTDYSGGWGRAFLQIPGSPPQDLGTLGYLWASATDVSNQGVVVGGSWSAPQQSSMHAFRWTLEGGIEDLGSLGGAAMAEAVNETGWIVGASQLTTSASSPSHAFIYRDGQMRDLNDLIHPLSGWVLNSAADINDLGQIVGTGLFNGQQRGFVLTPIAALVPGDFDGNGLVDAADINPFILAMVDSVQYRSTYDVWPQAHDLNGDGNINTEDINPFIQLLTGGGENTIIPEPASFTLLALSGLALTRRARGKANRRR